MAITNWFERGARGEEPYVTLVDKAKEANAAAVVEAEEYLRTHNEWRAKEAWLNRVRPIRHEVDVQLSGEVSVRPLIERVLDAANGRGDRMAGDEDADSEDVRLLGPAEPPREESGD